MAERAYLAIDLKSFYASVECAARGLDPLKTNLVVADAARTEKTICLAVSPSLKAYGIAGRARLFEVVQRVEQVNAMRRQHAPGRQLRGQSENADTLAAHPELALSFITAPPQMANYIRVSTQIYQIYLKYFAPEDIHVYSIDEVFIDATNYLNLYRLTPEKLAMKIILDILENTGITATAGIGTNLYLAKVAMDIVAKHIPADKNGVRIAQLDEQMERDNARMEELLAMMADPDFYVNEDASSDAIAEHAKLKQRLAAAEEEWFTLTEELEAEMARQQEQA